MFKKAIVLKVFNINEDYNLSTIKTIINDLDLKKYEIIPNIVDDNTATMVFSNILPNTVLCLSLNSDEERKVLLCKPMSSSHLQIPVKPGEVIWYFKDTTFSDSETNNLEFLSINHYWHSRASSDISNESVSITPITQLELNLFSNSSEIDINFNRLEEINGLNNDSFIQTQTYFSDSLILQDGNNNIISLNKNFDSGKINLISGFDLNIDDITDSKLNEFASVISINEQASLSDLMYNFDYLEESKFLTFDKRQKFIIDPNKHTFKFYEKDALQKLRNSNSFENITNTTEIFNFDDDNSHPNVTIKSNDIYIISDSSEIDNHLELFEDEIASDELYTDKSGKIDIVKFNINQKFNSRITIDEMNDIKIDGETIYIGNFIRNLANKKIINDELFDDDDNFNPETFIDDLADFEAINDLCGKGDGVVLGYEKSLSEPLVLGNTLVSLLKDMINLTNTIIEQNKSLIKEIKSMSDEYVNHTHPPVPTQLGPQSVKASLNISTHSGFKTKADDLDTKLEETKDKFNIINQNLKYTLSRFSKTS